MARSGGGGGRRAGAGGYIGGAGQGGRRLGWPFVGFDAARQAGTRAGTRWDPVCPHASPACLPCFPSSTRDATGGNFVPFLARFFPYILEAWF
jgi:hypothetical protein